MNITKFGAFVNILPGRDGLVHISKLGGGKRIDRVEDVLDLGDEIEVRVDDIDPNGKVSLTPVGDGAEGDGAAPSGSGDVEPAARAGSGGSSSSATASGDVVSFEDASTPRPARSSATSARPRRPAGRRPRAAAVGDAAAGRRRPRRRRWRRRRR